MPDIIVHPHGGRWSVAEAGAESPVKEFPTREAAAMAARQMAEGGSVEVLEEDPTTLGEGHSEGAEADPAAEGADPGLTRSVDTREGARVEQPGL